METSSTASVSGPRSRVWCVTIQNYGDDVLDSMIAWDLPEYVIAGEEVAPTTGTRHLQCYLRFPNAVRMSTIRTKFPGCHCEVARGTAEQNIAYCSKEGNFREKGDRPTTDQRIRGWLFELSQAMQHFDDVIVDRTDDKEARFRDSLLWIGFDLVHFLEDFNGDEAELPVDIEDVVEEEDTRMGFPCECNSPHMGPCYRPLDYGDVDMETKVGDISGFGAASGYPIAEWGTSREDCSDTCLTHRPFKRLRN